MTTILVADARADAHSPLCSLIAQRFSAVVQSASSRRDLLRQLEQNRWDLLLLDVRFAMRRHADLWMKIQRLRPDSPWLLVGDIEDERFAGDCIHAGSLGYLTRSDAVEVWYDAIACALLGKCFVSSRVAHMTGAEHPQFDGERYLELAKRDQKILQRLGDGASIEQIALERGIKRSTMETYRARIFRSMGFRSLDDALCYVRRCRVRTPPGTE